MYMKGEGANCVNMNDIVTTLTQKYTYCIFSSSQSCKDLLQPVTATYVLEILGVPKESTCGLLTLLLVVCDV